jgi:predicted nucleic acid-binding protein
VGIGDPPDWRRARTLALDTSAFIYHLEAHPTHASRLRPIFRQIEGGRCRGVSSTLTFLEVLVQPYRTGDDERRAALAALLASFPGVTWIPLDLAVADRAASLRARYRLRTPDAIQLATAVHVSADVFLTNDRDLRRVEEVPVLLIDECVDQ